MTNPTDENPADVPPFDTLPIVAVDTDAELASFAEYAKTLPTDDPEEVQERILRSLMTATTADDILRAGEAQPASTVYGVPLRIEQIRASESDFADGADLYLHVDAKILSNGDAITFSCGARDVVMKLIRLDQKKMLPIDAVIDESKKQTKAGYYPVFLRPLPPGHPAAVTPEEPFQ